MKKITRRLLIAGCALLLCISMLGFVSCTATESAQVLFRKAISRTVEQYEKFDLVSFAKDLGKGGKVKLTAENIKVPTGEESAVKGKGTAEFSFDVAKRTASATASAELDGKKYEASGYLSATDVAVKFDQVLDKVYGISLKNAEKNLAKSVFYYDGDSEYALPEEQYNMIIDALKTIEDNKDVEKTGKKLVDKYVKKLFGYLEKNAEYAKENTETKVLEESSVPAVLVTVSIDEKGLSAVIQSLWKDAKADKELKNFIADYILPLSGGNYEDVGDLYEDIDEEVDEFAEGAENADFEITVKYYLNKSSGAVMKGEVTLKSNGNKQQYTAELGNKFKSFEGIKLSTRRAPSGGSWSDTVYVWLKVVENTKEQLSLKLVGSDGAGVPEVSLRYDKAEDTVKVSMKDSYGDEAFAVKFGYVKKGSTITLKLTSLTQDGEKTDIPADFTLEISTKPSVSSIKKYTDILTLTEENIEDLKDNIEENLDKIEEDLTDQAKDSD